VTVHCDMYGAPFVKAQDTFGEVYFTSKKII
jgi:hypothetical protein